MENLLPLVRATVSY